MIEAVLFDLDGTLLDSAPDLVASLNFLRSSLGLSTLPVDELRQFASQGAAGLIKAGMPPCDKATLEQWLAIFLGHYAENSYVQSRPFEGVELLLSELTHRKIPWGIVTNKSEYLCIPILRKAGWLACAAVAVYGDSLKHRKPHPEPVLAACKILGLEPTRVLMVGDDPRDIEAGRQAGSPTALVLYGYGVEQCKGVAETGTTLINSPQEVLDLLGAMQNKTSHLQSCSGACHCGRVKFEIEIPDKITIHQCSCSICVKSGYLHLIVEASQFHLSSGDRILTEYRFHTGVARHLFCRQCGIKSFYVPRSHPQAYSVNLNCIELPPGIKVSFESFDGRHWSKNRENL